MIVEDRTSDEIHEEAHRIMQAMAMKSVLDRPKRSVGRQIVATGAMVVAWFAMCFVAGVAAKLAVNMFMYGWRFMP